MNRHFSSLALAVALTTPAVAFAGMPSVDLTDVARMRIETLSFFLVVFLVCGKGLQLLWNWLRTEHLPGLLPGTDADLVAAFTPIALEGVDAPGDVPRQGASDTRTVLLWFLNTPPEVAWEPVIAEHRRRLEEAGKGKVVAALPFIPTIPGSDTYTDTLWAD